MHASPWQTAGGVYLPDSKLGKTNEGEVVAVGPGRVTGSGTKIEVNVKVGETVLLPEYGGTTLTLGDEELSLFRDEDILGKFQVYFECNRTLGGYAICWPRHLATSSCSAVGSVFLLHNLATPLPSTAAGLDIPHGWYCLALKPSKLVCVTISLLADATRVVDGIYGVNYTLTPHRWYSLTLPNLVATMCAERELAPTSQYSSYGAVG